MKTNLTDYILELIKKFPEIVSGRKNYKKHDERIAETLKITRNYKKKTNL